MSRRKSFLIFVALVAMGIFFPSCNFLEDQPDRESLNQYGKLAIGIYLGRTVEDSQTSTVVYEYQVNNVFFENSDGYCYLDSDKAKDHFYFTNYPLLKGNKFVVLFDSLNPETSIIRLDYPLRDSTDFKSYIREFGNLRTEQVTEAP